MSVEFYVRLRDACNSEIERLKPSEAKDQPQTKAVSESNFDLTYAKHTGVKLGEFEIADEKDSPSDLYKHAFNILKQANATISNRYHGEDYQFSYWLYDGKIFRKLKK